jgi:hypothetical protein
MSKPHAPEHPDFSVAMKRGPRNFDGNAQRRVSLWLWAYVDRLEEADFVVMAESEALDWVILPLEGMV